MVKLFACGVNEYRGESELTFCVNDAKKFCDAFEENIVIEHEDICVVAKEGRISNTEYCKSLKSFCESAEEDDILVVFHSGHGGVDEDDDSFLMMTNSLNKDTCVYTDQIIYHLNLSKAKSKVVILDCCCSDVGEKFIPPINEKAVVEKFYATGMTVFCSCKKNEKSKSQDGKISVFTQFLCDALADKYLIREDVLFFNDYQNLVSVYAANYNRRHPDEKQTPVMRTSMIGTVAFPTRFHKTSTPNKTTYSFKDSEFDLLDISFLKKEGNAKQNRKFATVRVVMKVPFDEKKIERIIVKIVKKIEGIRITDSSWKLDLVKDHPIEIVNMTIHEDYIDYEGSIHRCHAIWTLHNDVKWHKKNIFKCNDGGYCSWDLNPQYRFLKNLRLNYTYTDEELVSFWKGQVDTVIKRTSEFDRKYHEYKAGDFSIKDLITYAEETYSDLNEIYNECDNSCFPIPFSRCKEFHDQSLKLVVDARSPIFICAMLKKENTEKQLQDCIESELSRYYQELKKWSDIIQRIN